MADMQWAIGVWKGSSNCISGGSVQSSGVRVFFIFGPKIIRARSESKRNMIKPPPLKPNDEIRLVSTARKISPQELEPAVHELKRWGFRVSLSRLLFEEDRQFAGRDEIRAQSLQEAFDDPNVKAIICVRGGYGTVRIIDRLDFNRFKVSPKWIAGYSDVTALHNHLHLNGFQSLHSTMPVNFSGNTTESLNSLFDALTGQALRYSFDSHPLNRMGAATGLITGGNISVLYSLMGTPTQVDTTGKILFLEDLDEYLYHVDRMLMNLKRSGMLSNLAGLIVGGLNDMNDNAIPFGLTAEETIAEAVREYNYPVCFNFPAGHLRDNRTIILGAKTKLAVGDSGASFEQSN